MWNRLHHEYFLLNLVRPISEKPTLAVHYFQKKKKLRQNRTTPIPYIISDPSRQTAGPVPTPPGPIAPQLLAHLTLLALVKLRSSRFLQSINRHHWLSYLVRYPSWKSWFRSPSPSQHITQLKPKLKMKLKMKIQTYRFPHESALFPSGGYSTPSTSTPG